MKTINKIGAIFLMFLAASIIVSCEDDEITRTPSPEVNPNSNNVYFPDQNGQQVVVGLNTDSVDVTIQREIYSQALTVNLKMGGNKDLFSIPSSVTFAAGDSVETFKLSVGDVELMKNYLVTLEIEGDQMANPYDTITPVTKYPSLSLNILKEDFAPYAEGTYTDDPDGFFGESWPQTLEYSPATNLYRFSDLWANGTDVLFSWDGGASVTVKGTAKTLSDVPYVFVPCGFTYSSYGMVYAYYPQVMETCYDDATKTFTFPITWRVSAGGFGTWNNTYTIETLD